MSTWRLDERAPVLSNVDEWFIGRVSFGDHVGYALGTTDGGTVGKLRRLSFQQVKDLPVGRPP